MNLVYTTNEAFTGKVAAGICSVFENNRTEKELKIYIIGQELTQESTNRFAELGKSYERKIEIIPLEEIQRYIGFAFDTGGWNPIVLARLVLEKLLPSEVKRVIYLDGDTIVLDSLHDLWNTDMKGKVLGGCIEATVNNKHLLELDMQDTPYINAGVLLLDLDKWRQQGVGTKILQYYQDNDGKLSANDQDAINGTLKNEIVYLNPRYNFYNIYWFYPYRMLKKLMGQAFFYSEEIVRKAIESPAIIHYLGEERPWRAGNHHKFRKEYEMYIAKTPWRDEKPEEGWKTYFFLWDIFNLVIRPFPMLRYQIIDGLIPLVMKWRKKQLEKTN